MLDSITTLRSRFDEIPLSPEWGFNSTRSTEQWTHGYHRYPAKFLPNIVKKLIEEYTSETDVVADFFAGCGTTLVEAKIHGRKSVGVDINPVAQLITKAKTIPVEPHQLQDIFLTIAAGIDNFNADVFEAQPMHERIDYWFDFENKQKIAYLYSLILDVRDPNSQNFFLCALSNILKNCSRWLQSGTKPQIDPDKVPSEPFAAFLTQAKSMLKKNAAFYAELQKLDFLNVDCDIFLEDARSTSIESDSITAIITSPPYVTSYEYADIHQLTGFWYDYIQNLRDFRKNFIGTFFSLNQETKTLSAIGQEIVDQLHEKDKRYAKEVANYFNDMHDVAREMHRVLKKEGHVCMVIGNTTFQEVKIKSAEVFSEILILLGFKLIDIIKRSIPHKIIPTIRDNKTGRFTKLDNKNGKLVYPEEYILIARK